MDAPLLSRWLRSRRLELCSFAIQCMKIAVLLFNVPWVDSKGRTVSKWLLFVWWCGCDGEYPFRQYNRSRWVSCAMPQRRKRQTWLVPDHLGAGRCWGAKRCGARIFEINGSQVGCCEKSEWILCTCIWFYVFSAALQPWCLGTRSELDRAALVNVFWSALACCCGFQHPANYIQHCHSRMLKQAGVR